MNNHLDGAAWRPYNAAVVVGDGAHTLRVRAVDAAGNVQETTLDFQVDGTRPGMTLPERWPIWEKVTMTVHDGQSGLAKVEMTIRDKQDRWPAVVWTYAADGASFTTEMAWDRRFADGTIAPIGEYEVTVEARDAAGNVTWETAHLLIPPPGVTPSPAPTRTPTSTATVTPAPSDAPSSLSAQPAPTATRAAVVSAFHFSEPSTVLPSLPSALRIPNSAFPLWGAAAWRR